MTLKSVLASAIKVLNKTTDVTKPSAENVEIGPLTRENAKTFIRVLRQKEVELLIKKHEEEEAKAECEKKEKEQKTKDKIEDKTGGFRSLFGHNFSVKAVLFHTEKALAFLKPGW